MKRIKYKVKGNYHALAFLKDLLSVPGHWSYQTRFSLLEIEFINVDREEVQEELCYWLWARISGPQATPTFSVEAADGATKE